MNVDDLPERYFLDTNIFVYTFDASAPEKQKIANELIQSALETGNGVISTQVVQEFLNVALRKFKPPMSHDDALAYVRHVLAPLCEHAPSILFYEIALSIREETGYSLYDTLIVTAALTTNCTLLLSEDMQTGRKTDTVEIINPFN